MTPLLLARSLQPALNRGQGVRGVDDRNRALLAYRHNKLARVPAFSYLKEAAPRQGFFGSRAKFRAQTRGPRRFARHERL